jgi:intracellular sulfur oxidation DsrE/DsrF family protein
MIRRSFLSSLGAAIAIHPPTMPAQSTVSATWQPARHAEDDWLDKIPGKHRLLFDTTSPQGLGSALLYSNNFLDTNKNAYALDYSDVALVIVVRHESTPFGFNDAMWSKYGRVFSDRIKFNDPKTQQAPEVNLYNASGYGQMLANSGITLESLTKRGAHLAVCRLATRNLAGRIASATGGAADKINEELIANIVTSAHMVPAGIVTVSRAQERGYTFAYGL